MLFSTLLLSSSASALVVGSPHAGCVRVPSPVMLTDDAAKAAWLAKQDAPAWGDQAAPPPATAYPATVYGTTDKFGVGRKAAIPLGGTTAWGATDEQKAYAIETGKFGTGRVVPTALGGTNAWGAATEGAAAQHNPDVGKFGTGRRMAAPLGGTAAWEPTEQRRVQTREDGKFGVGRKAVRPMGGVNPF